MSDGAGELSFKVLYPVILQILVVLALADISAALDYFIPIE
jgi:hypothetical protein